MDVKKGSNSISPYPRGSDSHIMEAFPSVVLPHTQKSKKNANVYSSQSSNSNRRTGCWNNILPRRKQSYNLLQTIKVLNMIPSPVCLMNAQGVVMHSNELFDQCTGIESPQHYKQLITPEDFKRFNLLLHSQHSQQSSDINYSTSIDTIKNDSFLSKSNQSKDYISCEWTISNWSEECDCAFITIKYLPEAAKKIFDESLSTSIVPIAKADSQNNKENKSTFVKYVSHEIRTPLTVLMTGLDLLLIMVNNGTGSRFDMNTYLEEMHYAGEVAIEVLNNILEFELINNSTRLSIILVKSRCNLNHLLQRRIDLFSVEIKHSEINVTLCTSKEGSVFIMGNETKLSQAFHHMILNGILFTPAGGSVTVTILVDEITQEVRIEVLDSGPGILAEAKAALFKSGDDIDRAELQGAQGTGLGLYITRHIIEMHGGGVGVDEDRTGGGSLFFMELPLDSFIEGYIEEDILAKILHSKVIVRNDNRFYRILIVDDMVVCRKMIVRAVAPICSDFIEAANGENAIEMLQESINQKKPFDCVLMDSSMPKMTGPKATEIMRGMGYRGKIFGVTGNALQADIDDFVAHGADEVFIKPIIPRVFIDRIEKLLSI